MGQLRSPGPEMGVRLPLYGLGKPGAQYRFVLSHTCLLGLNITLWKQPADLAGECWSCSEHSTQ